MIPIQATCASINSVIILIVSIIYTVMMMKKGSIISTRSSTRGITFACMKPSFRLSLIKMHWNIVNGCRNCILHPPIIKAGWYYQFTMFLFFIYDDDGVAWWWCCMMMSVLYNDRIDMLDIDSDRQHLCLGLVVKCNTKYNTTSSFDSLPLSLSPSSLT